MSPRTSDIADMHDLHEPHEREISLGTSTVLGIFFALALVCSGFFGFGYTLGRKSVQSGTIALTDSSAESFHAFKPAPGNPANLAATPKDSAISATPTTVTVPLKASVVPKKPVFDPDAEIVTTVPPEAPKAAPIVRSAPSVPPAASAGGNGSAIVQVSAFRRQEDADMVASALRKKGYTVFIRSEPQDNYLHVQLGPYASKKDAEAMRERLSADGFNAMVK